jgi:hypothetical protein
MPLLETEIAPGVVAYFDHELLLREPEVERNDDAIDRPGPFVCIQVEGARSVWCAITSRHRPERLPIASSWREAGGPSWRVGDAFLVDGLNTYVGPSAAFVRAAAAERPFYPHLRPRISTEGIAAIIEEVRRQGGPVLVAGKRN